MGNHVGLQEAPVCFLVVALQLLIRELLGLVYADVDLLQIGFVHDVQDMFHDVSYSLEGGEDMCEQLLDGVGCDASGHINNLCVVLLFPVDA